MYAVAAHFLSMVLPPAGLYVTAITLCPVFPEKEAENDRRLYNKHTFNRFYRKGRIVMAVASKMSAIIEKEIEALTRSDYRRPGTSMNKFIGEFSGLLAQAEEDRDMLVASGLDGELLPKYRALLEMLSLAYGDRLGTTPESPEQRVDFNEKMALAENDRRRLGVVGAHIAEKSNDPPARSSYRRIAKGSGSVDTLTDNLGLVTLIKEYPELAAEIKPGGVEITAAYMDEVVTRAVNLLQMRGIVVEKGVPRNEAVDRQNRLLTLCLNAQSHIKKYAYAAFFDNIEYYNSNYASPGGKPAVDVEETATEIPVAAG